MYLTRSQALAKAQDLRVQREIQARKDADLREKLRTKAISTLRSELKNRYEIGWINSLTQEVEEFELHITTILAEDDIDRELLMFSLNISPNGHDMTNDRVALVGKTDILIKVFLKQPPV